MREYGSFKTLRYIPELDGLRAASILLVLTIHSHVTALRPLNGYTGVVVFFAISGFLITTLLLREQDTFGRVSFAGFYVRRAFRIFPLYYLALLTFTLAVLAGFGENPGNFGRRLIFFLTYTNEFASPGTFGHSWSLAIEEKFYFVWPIVGFGIAALARRRTKIAAAALGVASIVGLFWPDDGYIGIYVPILAGCLLACLMHVESTFETIRRLATPLVGSALIGLLIVVLLLSTTDRHTHVPFGIAITLALPVILLGPAWIRAPFAAASMRWMGRRSFAVYLFHPLVGSVVDSAIPARTFSTQVLHLILMAAGSFGLAELLYRYFEQPLIKVGHRLAHRYKPTVGLPAFAVGEPERDGTSPENAVARTSIRPIE